MIISRLLTAIMALVVSFGLAANFGQTDLPRPTPQAGGPTGDGDCNWGFGC